MNPGQTVLCKTTPPWPALVMHESDLPIEVMQLKPAKKKSVPVVFFNDNTYQWMSPDEIQELSVEQSIKMSKQKIKKVLKEAYAIAATQPSFEDLKANSIEQVSTPPKKPRARSAADQAKNIPKLKKAKILTPKAEEEDEYIDTSSSASSSESDLNDIKLQNKQTSRINLCLELREQIQMCLKPVLEGKKPDLSLKEKINSLVRTLVAGNVEVSVLRRTKLIRVVNLVVMMGLELDVGGVLEYLEAEAKPEVEAQVPEMPEAAEAEAPEVPPKEEEGVPEVPVPEVPEVPEVQEQVKVETSV